MSAKLDEDCLICGSSEPCDHMIERLESVLNRANARATFDRGRNNTHPCTFCGCSPAQREMTVFELVDLGTYKNGEVLTRPVCTICKAVSLLGKK